VKVGDEVLAVDKSGKVAYSPVVSIPHLKNDIPGLFHRLVLSSGADIHMTAEHLIFVGSCLAPFSEYRLRPAAKVPMGACVWTVSGSDLVVQNEVVQGRGMYSIVTELPYLVVNNIFASPFAVNHFVADVFYGIYRFGYRVFPSLFQSQLFTLLHSELSAALTSLSSLIVFL
jgi:hypothetical protein